MSNPSGFDIEDPKLPKWIKNAAMLSGGYPYPDQMDDDEYETELHSAYLQLALLQEHTIKAGTRIVMVFEGRDAAGKGGTIRTYLMNLNPRHNIHVALPQPNERERQQWYFQRYVDWMPANTETVLFDRSWYNRSGVEPVMGFCTEAQSAKFLSEVPHFEQMLVNDGIHVMKFWLSIGREMQMKRFHDRRHDPLKRWKLSPVDMEAIPRFDAYTAARNRTLEASHTAYAPWTVVLNNCKRRGRLAVIRSVLRRLDYEGKDTSKVGPIDPKIVFDAPSFLAREDGD